ncbi:MAG: dihydrolipoamide acetyltransferase family protein [Spirochaetota bacterium]
MATEVILPRQGQSVESCIIASWHAAEGEIVEEGQVICEVETDKASFEVEATATGTLLKRYFAENDDVPVLTTLAMIGEPGEAVPDSPPSGGAGGAPTEGAAKATGSDEAQPAAPAATGEVAPSRVQKQSPGSGDGKLRISPRARLYAERLGVAPETLTGSGPGGRIIVRDVETAAPAGAAATPAPQAPARPAAGEYPGPAEELPLKGVRKITAERMLASVQQTAQLTLNRTADARALIALRKRVKARAAGAEGRGSITINDMVLFAVARALGAHPEMNAHLEKGIIRRFSQVHLGFAVDTDRGLYVPTIRNADSLTLRDLAEEARRLGRLCQEGKAGAEELVPATFTVTNLGALGIESFTPVLNPPQIAILGVSAIRPAPRTAEAGVASETSHEGSGDTHIEWVPSIGLSLTIDHQGIDGAPAARFLKTLAEYIADFDLTLTA